MRRWRIFLLRHCSEGAGSAAIRVSLGREGQQLFTYGDEFVVR